MQDVDLFVHMAEIAGVFVGFGALIAIRSGGALAAGEVSSLRWVTSSAIWVVIAALVPILVAGYGVTGHQLWLACSLVAVVLYAIFIAVNATAAENRADLAATLTTTSRVEIVAVMGPTFWLPTFALAGALALVVLGIFPEREQAIYLSAVGLGLFMSALHLFVTVFWQRQPVRR